MLRKFLLGLMFVFVVGGFGLVTADAGTWAVGSKFKPTAFPQAQSQWGIRGYYVIEPNALERSPGYSGTSPIYNTTTNHSMYGSETIIVYEGPDQVYDFNKSPCYCAPRDNEVWLRIYKWIPSGHDYLDSLHGTTNPTYWHWEADRLISNGDGNIVPEFTPYINYLWLDGVQKPCLRFENTSNYSTTTGRWYEKTRLYNFNTGTWEILMQVSWAGTLAENYVPTTDGGTKGAWAGAVEIFATDTFPSWSGKKIGVHVFDFMGPSGWTPLTSTYATLKTSHTGTGFTVTNPNPSPGTWRATVP